MHKKIIAIEIHDFGEQLLCLRDAQEIRSYFYVKTNNTISYICALSLPKRDNVSELLKMKTPKNEQNQNKF